MAIAFVQSNKGAVGTNTETAAFTGNTTTGNSVFVAIGVPSGVTVNSVTDSQANTYTQAISQASSTPNTVQIWYCPSIVGGTTPTITPNYSGIGKSAVIIYEFSGLSYATIDQTNFGTNSTGAPTTSSINTLQANDLLFAAAVTINNSGATTVGTGYSNFLSLDFLPLGNDSTLYAQTQIVSSTGSYTGAFAGTNAAAYADVIASFYAGVKPNSTTSGANYESPHHIIVGDGMSRSEVAN